MRTVKIVVAGLAVANLFMSAASAEQTMSGMITKIDRLNGTIAIQQTQDGTVGANTGGVTPEFKVQDAKLLDDVHAGDRVTFSTTDNGGAKTITTLKRQ